MITLMWMIEQLKPHLSFEINATNLAITDRFLLMRPVVEGLIKTNKKDHWLIKKINALMAKDKTPDLWNDGGLTKTKILAADALMGWASGPIIDSFEGNMTKAGSQYRTPGEYKASKDQSGKPVKLGRTHEAIHPTVAYRMQHLGADGYDPVPLKGFKRQKKRTTQKQADGRVEEVISYEWVKGDVRVPEYKIGGMLSHERTCPVSDSARAWLGRLDKECGVDSWEARQLDAPPQPAPENHGFQPAGGFQPVASSGDPFQPVPSSDPGFQPVAQSDSGFLP